MIERFIKARAVSTPLIAIRTADQVLTASKIKAKAENGAMWVWDCINGIKPANTSAMVSRDPFEGQETTNSVTALEVALTKLPKNGILCVKNGHRGLTPGVNPNWVQAVSNLREAFKGDKRTLVLLVPDIQLPPELAQDVVIIDDPLPGPDVLKKIVTGVLEQAGTPNPPTELVTKAAEILGGISPFAAEQAAAMALYRGSSGAIELDLTELWTRKRQTIASTPGLSIWEGRETFEKVGGCANIKHYVTRLLAGPGAPRAVVLLDEIEKSIGTGLDTSGTSQAYLGMLLSFMQDQEASGMLFVGPPGSAKSMVAKATGNAAGVPKIAFDLGGMKNSLVGESESRLRNALKVVSAIGGNQILFIATSNRIDALPPELRRRFNLGTFYFPLPSAAERQAIWGLHLKEYNLADVEAFDDDQWTGAEIQQCCMIAHRLGVNIREAAHYVVSVAKSAPEQVEGLARQAHDRYICASYPGVYRHPALSAAHGAEKLMMEMLSED